MTATQQQGDAQLLPTEHAEAPSKAERFWSVFRSVLLSGAAIIGGASIVLFAVALFLGMRTHIVISGSMEPEIPTGSLVFVQPVPASEVRVGDVVTVERPDDLGLITHRVIAIEPDAGLFSLTLQGDANASPDPNQYLVAEAGSVRFEIPYLGYIALFLRTPMGIVALIAAGIGLVLAYFSGNYRKSR